MLCDCFFFNDTATTEIYTLSLHDALPIYQCVIAFLALTLLPVFVAGFYGLTSNMNNWGEDNIEVSFQSQNLGVILGDFMTIVIIMGINVVLLAGATFFYYRNRPPSLRSEIRRLEEQYK